VVEGKRVSRSAAVGVAVVFGVALGGAAAIGVALGWTEPYWVPEPVLLLLVYILVGKRERVWQKALGTAVGVIAVVPVAIAAPPTWAIYLIAAVALLLAVMTYQTYWLYYAFFTFSLVLVFAPSGQVGAVAAHRGVEILAGTAILLAGLAVLYPLGIWLAKRYPEPELADNDEPAESPNQPSPAS